MRYSRLFGKTEKKVSEDIKAISHKYLYQAGFIRESSSGRFYFLPLGIRTVNKIINIIRQEMNNAGAQELITPVLHPLELWKETNRTNEAGFELMKVMDRRRAEFALGGTAEEMIVDLVRKFNISYRDLPFNIYQFSTKFRDELRARGGLLRVREFIMKDAYSFDIDDQGFKKEYKNMWETYIKIFNRLGLETTVVESDNGYIGGEYCHEFVVENNMGESKYFITKDNSYAAHEDIASFDKEIKNTDQDLKPLQQVKAKRGTTMEDGVIYHKLPLWQQIKNVLYKNEKGEYILAIIRGDYEINELKLKKASNSLELVHASGEEILTQIHSVPGFISPVGIKKLADPQIKLLIVADNSLRTIKNAYGGANKINLDNINMNIDRDYKPDIETDIALAKAGYETKDGKELIEKNGIEVGNIFQLGYHYTNLMKGADFTDSEGKRKPYYMGCYGIGIGRTMAAVVEMHHDKGGIIWPDSIAPYKYHLLALDLGDIETKSFAENVYRDLLEKGQEVLFDDREEITAGQKFTDADLIGLPIRLVISKRNKGRIEVKRRGEDQISFTDNISSIP